MPDADPLLSRYPLLSGRLPRVPLADLPTPISEHLVAPAGTIRVKHDDRSASLYGGNKVRKLEYLLGRTLRRGRRRVATFGAIASNHALATALHARRLGIEPVCFLSHQTRTPLAAQALDTHLHNRTEIVPFHGSTTERLAILRRHLWHTPTDVIPLGGSSWVGTVGPLAAGLELVEQIAAGALVAPARVYLAAGTLGTAAGIALGLALGGLATEVHAVRVSHTSIANDAALSRLAGKTAAMLHRIDKAFPADLASRCRLILRHEYFAPGYAHSNPPTDAAIDAAADAGLRLEPTYTGKALAALLADVRGGAVRPDRALFWNTYNSAASPFAGQAEHSRLPEEFRSYCLPS